MWRLLADELGRAREELRRSEDRLSRPEGELTKREKVRLRGLMLRSDAFGNALDALEVLREEGRRVREEFARYRAEGGIPGPARKDVRRLA